MNFDLEIGQVEQHKIHFQRNCFTGRMLISVDSRPVVTNNPYNPLTHFSIKLTHKYKFTVGNNEKHDVCIERIRPLWFSGFRPLKWRVIVDGDLVKEIKGY